MASVSNKVKSSKELYKEGQQIAAGNANNAAGLAAKEARAAMMEGGQGKLAAALQSAQARADAATSAYNEGIDKAASQAAAQNQMEQQMATQQAQLDAQKEQMENENNQRKKDRIANIAGTAAAGVFSMFSDEGCKKFAARKVFK